MELVKYASYEEYKAQLDRELGETAQRFVRIGYLLKVARDTDILHKSGYSNVVEFAKAEYGIDKTAVSRFININDKFASGGYSERLEERYEGYGYAKLSIMLTLPDDVNEVLSKDLSKSEIIDIKSEIEAEQNVTPIETMMEGTVPAMEDMSELTRVVYQLGHDQPDIYAAVLNAFKTYPVEEAMWDAMAPEGEKIYFVRIRGIGKKMFTVSTEKKKICILDARQGTMEGMYSLDEVMTSWAELGMDPKRSEKENWERTYKEKQSEQIKEPVKESVKEPEKQQAKEKRKESKVVKAKKVNEGNELGKKEEQKRSEEPKKVQEGKKSDIQEQEDKSSRESSSDIDPEREVQEVEEQLPGQTNIEDFPEFMPQPETEGPDQEREKRATQLEGSMGVIFEEMMEEVRKRNFNRVESLWEELARPIQRMKELYR